MWPQLRRFAGTKLCIYVRKKTYTEAAVDKPCLMGGTSTGAAVTSGKANVGMSLVISGVADAVMLERVGCELRMPVVDVRLCTGSVPRIELYNHSTPTSHSPYMTLEVGLESRGCTGLCCHIANHHSIHIKYFRFGICLF